MLTGTSKGFTETFGSTCHGAVSVYKLSFVVCQFPRPHCWCYYIYTCTCSTIILYGIRSLWWHGEVILTIRTFLPYRVVPCQEQSQGIHNNVCNNGPIGYTKEDLPKSVFIIVTISSMITYVGVPPLLCRRTIDYQEVLDALSEKGIAIRVASPKLVMEEVCVLIFPDIFELYPFHIIVHAGTSILQECHRCCRYL